MRVLKRHRFLTTLAAVVVLEWGALATVYLNLSWRSRMEIETNPFALLAFGAAWLAFLFGLLVMLVVATVAPFRPFLPTALGGVLAFAGVVGILDPFIATSGCGCESGL